MTDKNIRQNKLRDRLPATGSNHIDTLVENAIKAMAVLREFKPRVHCITNTVAQNITANILLACGAIPSMSVAFDEIADFTSRADALLINLGTMDTERTKSVRWAVRVAEQNARPYVLDPVFAQASAVRLALAKQLASAGPAIIRANRDEANALFGDSTADLEECARQHQSCIVITGRSDLVIDSHGSVEITNGTPVMAKVSGMGCALTALMAALAAVEKDRIVAAGAALFWFNIAAEIATEKAAGPGSFVAHFIDALAAMDGDTFRQRARFS